MKVDKDNAMDRANLMEEAVKRSKIRMEKAEEEYNELVTKFQQLEKDLDVTTETLSARTQQLKDKEKALAAAEAKENALQRRIQALEDDLEKCEEKNNTCTEKLDKAGTAADDGSRMKSMLEDKANQDEVKMQGQASVTSHNYASNHPALQAEVHCISDTESAGMDKERSEAQDSHSNISDNSESTLSVPGNSPRNSSDGSFTRPLDKHSSFTSPLNKHSSGGVDNLAFEEETVNSFKPKTSPRNDKSSSQSPNKSKADLTLELMNMEPPSTPTNGDYIKYNMPVSEHKKSLRIRGRCDEQMD